MTTYLENHQKGYEGKIQAVRGEEVLFRWEAREAVPEEVILNEVRHNKELAW